MTYTNEAKFLKRTCVDGAVLGEMSLYPGYSRKSNAVAMSKCHAFYLDGVSFL